MKRAYRLALRELPLVMRLDRLHRLAVQSEVSAAPCTAERMARGQRSDRIYNALKRVRLEGGWAA